MKRFPIAYGVHWFKLCAQRYKSAIHMASALCNALFIACTKQVNENSFAQIIAVFSFWWIETGKRSFTLDHILTALLRWMLSPDLLCGKWRWETGSSPRPACHTVLGTLLLVSHYKRFTCTHHCQMACAWSADYRGDLGSLNFNHWLYECLYALDDWLNDWLIDWCKWWHTFMYMYGMHVHVRMCLYVWKLHSTLRCCLCM